MQLTKWQPFHELEDFFRRISPGTNGTSLAQFDDDGRNIARWAPSADITESKRAYLVKAQLPDVDKEDIRVTIQHGMLTITGERKHSKEDEEETYHRVESFYGEFTRSFSLPDNIDDAGITADYKKGVLRVHIPKLKETPKESSTKIKVS
ncbi:MAG: Hsp20/alpha crystallin family protein [Pseudomonadota bacterium]